MLSFFVRDYITQYIPFVLPFVMALCPFCACTELKNEKPYKAQNWGEGCLCHVQLVDP